MTFIEVLRSISLRGAIRMWQRNWRVFRKLFFRATAPTLVEPVIYLLGLGAGLGLFIREIEGMSYIQFIAPGLLAASAMFGASYECTFNSFVRMKYEKVYDAALATPLTIEDVVVAEMFWGATRSFLHASIFLAVIALFGLVKSTLALLLLPILFISGLMFAVMAMIFTAIVSDISLFNYYFEILVMPLFFFSGIFFPVRVLPGWAQTLARFTPLYHVVRICRQLVMGKLSLAVGESLIWIVVFTAILFLLPVVLMKRRLIK